MSYTPFKMKGPSLLKMVKKGKRAYEKFADQMPGRSELELKALGPEKATELAEKRYRDYKAKEKAKKDFSLKMSSEKKKKKGLADDGKNQRILKEMEKLIPGKYGIRTTITRGKPVEGKKGP